jgi:glutathione S-transferase
MARFINPFLGQKRSDDVEDFHFKLIIKSLRMLENNWLKTESQKFLMGDEITIADLSAACELAQMTAIADLDPRIRGTK